MSFLYGRYRKFQSILKLHKKIQKCYMSLANFNDNAGFSTQIILAKKPMLITTQKITLKI